ncbi:Uncharacterized protein Fot_06114 [Forsythia ovata]|uniref:Secreted protein n=1 Tax=Forsythia ovata TaxID=205694 RepID=A0ABD1WS21_9LAMI
MSSTFLLSLFFLSHCRLQSRRPPPFSRCRLRRNPLHFASVNRLKSEPQTMATDRFVGVQPAFPTSDSTQSAKDQRRSARWDDNTHWIFVHCCEVLIAQVFGMGKVSPRPDGSSLSLCSTPKPAKTGTAVN